jgi:hypothetical protein
VKGSAPSETKKKDIKSTALGKGRWWYTLTGWHFIRDPPGTNGLKERAAGAVGE